MSRATSSRSSGESLVQRIISGDMQAEEELVHEFSRGVRFVLRRESRDVSVVDDLFQETFRIAIEKIRKGDLRDPRKVAAFLASTARFVAIDHFRRESRHEAADIDDIEVPLPGRDQLQDLLSRENALLVRQLIGDLKSERDRAILFRFYIGQEEKEQICRELELTNLHFNRVLHRAKQRYKALLEQVMEAQNATSDDGRLASIKKIR